jgi:hypothetical protein
MSKNSKLSALDVNQIVKAQFEEDMDAQRVYLVGGDLALAVKEAVKEGMSNLKIDIPRQEQPLVIETEVIVKETQIVEVEKIVMVPQIVEIEKTIFIKEPQIVEVEKPMIIIEPRFVEIERPVFIDRIKVDIPQWLKFVVFCESIILIGVLLSYLNKGH